MKLKVNRAKSAVDLPVNRVFLGYSFTSQQSPKIRVPEKTGKKMRGKLKELFRTGRGRKLETFRQEDLNPILRGWVSYYRLSETKGFAEALDGWVRRRRCIIWIQWKKAVTRYKRLMSRGLEKARAYKSASNDMVRGLPHICMLPIHRRCSKRWV